MGEGYGIHYYAGAVGCWNVPWFQPGRSRAGWVSAPWGVRRGTAGAAGCRNPGPSRRGAGIRECRIDDDQYVNTQSESHFLPPVL